MMFSQLLVLPLLLAGSPSLATASGESDASALASALTAVREDSYRADLHFLASDALRGRNTPSPELRIAALYLKNRVQRLGFQPGAKDGWFQDYPLHSYHLDVESSYVRASTQDGDIQFTFAEDYYFLKPTHAQDMNASGSMICVGKGSKRSLTGLDLEGKWALLLDTGKVSRSGANRCFEAGAIGVVVTPGPSYSESRGSYVDRFQDRSDNLLSPSTPSFKPRGDSKVEGPIVMLKPEAALRLYALAGTPLVEGAPEPGTELSLQLTEQRSIANEDVMVSNVCAFWPGSDPELAGQTMIISAHYDHIGERNGEIYNGADDNASGTCGLLALADALVAYGPLKRSVLLLWVSGEEKGLWGSEIWSKSPWLPNDSQAVLDLNIDMIGRTEDDELYITPSREHDAFNSVAQVAYDLAEREGFGELQKQDEYWSRSDHMNFYRFLDIPVAFLSSGNHPDYHKPTDTPDKIKTEKSTRIVRLVFRMLHALQETDLGL
jgi:hypothetical protein